MLPQYNNKHNKVLLCLTDTSLYIYICVKHFGIVNIKKKKIYSKQRLFSYKALSD